MLMYADFIFHLIAENMKSLLLWYYHICYLPQGVCSYYHSYYYYHYDTFIITDIITAVKTAMINQLVVNCNINRQVF